MPLDASSCSKSAAGLSVKASNSGFGPGVQRTFDVRHTSVVRPMFESLSQRTVIIGNSGAGKSALAERLAALIHVPVIDLDLLNWEGDGYGDWRTGNRRPYCSLTYVLARSL